MAQEADKLNQQIKQTKYHVEVINFTLSQGHISQYRYEFSGPTKFEIRTTEKLTASEAEKIIEGEK